jgi:hypothetical protein
MRRFTDNPTRLLMGLDVEKTYIPRLYDIIDPSLLPETAKSRQTNKDLETFIKAEWIYSKALGRKRPIPYTKDKIIMYCHGGMYHS